MTWPMIVHPFVVRLVEKRVPPRQERWRSSRFRPLRASGRTPRRPTGSWAGWKLAALTGLIVLAWLGIVFLVDPVRFVILNPRGKTGIEMFLALGQLFGALVLALSPAEAAHSRMRWVATGLLVLGVGGLGFGYLYPLVERAPSSDVVIYGSIFVRGLATILIAVGLVPANPPPLRRRTMVALLGISGMVGVVLALTAHLLPPLVRMSELESVIAVTAGTSFPGLTGWYLGLGLIPLAAGVAAIWGAVRHDHDVALHGWLVVAVVLLTGAHLHAMFWPSMYTSILTTTSVLRLGSTIIIVIGGIVALRTLSLERTALLADERERVRQLEELRVLRRDFTSMVAHELVTPLSAIANLAQMITLGVLSQSDRQTAAIRIQKEAEILQRLVRDIQASADIERDDFAVRACPVPLDHLLADARAYAQTVQSSHPLSVATPSGLTVVADAERIGQVLRNLLNNAVRHTPAGTPIALGAVPRGEAVRIEVRDSGPGIDPADQTLILEKYGRGHRSGTDGRGLGLYLSQRILQAHGTELIVESEPGHGACFSFSLIRLEESP